jgi:UMF1 family MFS transporter
VDSILAADPALSLEAAEEQATSYFTGLSSRIAFLTVGLWWFGFAQITFRRLPSNIYHKKPKGQILTKGYQELGKVVRQLMHMPGLKIYLLGFFFFSTGVQTVMYLAPTFAEKEIIGMESTYLIIIVLIIQVVAIGGAFLFAWLSKLYGNISALLIASGIWVGICIGVYFVHHLEPFIVAAFTVGLVMGGSQAIARSTYSKLLPETHDHASFFSFYDICEKLSIVLGTMAFGVITQITGSTRNALFALLIYFIIGAVLLLAVYKNANSAQQANIKGNLATK